MSTVRPPIFPTPQPSAQGASPARSAAQRAFFQAAMGESQAPMAARAQAPQAQPQAPVHRVPTNLPDEPPQKILRPGSLLDIRV